MKWASSNNGPWLIFRLEGNWEVPTTLIILGRHLDYLGKGEVSKPHKKKEPRQSYEVTWYKINNADILPPEGQKVPEITKDDEVDHDSLASGAEGEYYSSD